MSRALQQPLLKVPRLLLAAAVLVLTGCFNDINGPADSLVWISSPVTLEQYRGDNGELQHSLRWQTGVLDMAFDAQSGLLWALRRNGELAAYDADAVQLSLGHVELGGNPKNVFLRAHGGNVWLAAHKSLSLITAAGAQWQIDVAADILGIELDSGRNRLWVVTDKKILGYNAAGALYIEINLPKKTGPLGPIAYDVINDRVLIAADKELQAYALNGTLVRRASMGRIEQLVADVGGIVWAADNKKLYRLNPLTLAVISSQAAQKKITQLRRDPFNPGVWALAEDAISWVNAQGAYQGSFFAGLVPRLFAVAYRLETDTRPELSIVQPAEQALVGPHPEFVLRAIDDSGIAESSFSFNVNSVAAASTCGLDAAQANHYRCNLQAALHEITQSADARYRIEVTVADNDGTLSLPAAVTVLLDRDRDGVHDAADLCPHTPVPEAVDANGCSASQRDADHDTVTDNLDLCPDTPQGEPVDAFGCSASQRDTDGDEITDNLDICPNTPAGEPADAAGCSASQRDGDSDGITDNLDQCPHTPDGVPVDGSGCADSQRDSDHDTVNDALDLCPNTPMAEVADSNGCSASQRDADHDTVTDNLDLCPDTPQGEPADAFGCSASQRDTDGDTVTDNLDLCPATPDGEAADASGCSASQRDTDGDTVTDNLDQCPATPDGKAVDSNGCADSERDTDHDNVTDDLDQCPATPEDEPVDAQGCGASQRDGDADGVSDAADDCPATPEGTSVGTDGCADFERDTDHDAVPDIQDAFPNDSTRSRLPAVENLTASLHAGEERILVAWQVPQNPENVHAYHVYRAEGTSGDLQLISATPVAGLSFVDVDIANGSLYRYRVVAVTMNSLEGEPGALVSVFAAFNNTVVEGLTAQRQPINVKLQWQAIPGQQYRIYRALDTTTPNFAPLLDVTNNEYLDTGVVWNQGYQYRVTGLLNFTHPETGAALIVEGPPSAPVTAAALPPLSVSVFDVVTAADGVLEKLLTTQAEVTVSGRYTNAIGPVQITATANGSSITVAGDNGSFRLTLPVMASGTLWNLSFTETTVADRGATVVLRVLLDAMPPVIVLNNPAQTVLNSDIVTVSGTVTDNSGSVDSINMVSDRFPGTSFGVILEGGNTFSVEVPLLFGANILTATATDPAGNAGQASLTFNRTIGVAPIVEILSPLNGAIVQTDRVNIAGRLYTSLTPDKIRIISGDEILFPEAGATPGIYNFTFNNLLLQPGVNNLSVRAETTAGNASAVVAVIYQDAAPPVGQAQAPVIQITNPNLNSYTRNDSIVIAGFVTAAAGPVSLRINNTPVDLVGQSSAQGYFQYLADLSGVEGAREFNLVATDGANRTASRTLSITRDTGLPVITLNDANLQLAPAVNTITALPFNLQGQVQDANLGGLSINGNTISLQATPDAATFEFNAALNLPLNANTSAVLQAWDRAGNSRTQELILNANPQTTVEIISPRAGESLRLSAPATVAVVARLSIVEPGYTVSARIDQGAAVTMTADVNAMTANVPLDLAVSSHTLTITVSEQSNPQVASASISFNTEDLANIPLALERSEPANNATGVEPNESINLYFNKPIDPALLQIEVRETVNGLTFNIERSENPDFFPSLENAEPVAVHRNQELVPGESGMLTGNTVAVFYPQRDFAYHAELYVTVRYAGAEFERFTFKVREIPTFVQGLVLDPASQPIGGLTISLPALGLEAVTNSNGSYAIGFGLPERALPGGRHEIVFNPGRADPAFAEIRQWVNVQKGQLNRNGGMVVPFLNAEIPFRPINSRQATAILAEGDLVLDLSQADLRFPNGRTGGDVHVQFAAAGQYSHATLPGIEPQWVFAVQPPGIALTGKVGVTLELPALNGSFSYLPVDPIYVVMLGFDLTSKQIVPVGVGRLENQKVTATLSELRALDYLGYVIVPTDQKILEDYANGAISLQALIQAVTSGAVNNE